MEIGHGHVFVSFYVEGKCFVHMEDCIYVF